MPSNEELRAAMTAIEELTREHRARYGGGTLPSLEAEALVALRAAELVRGVISKCSRCGKLPYDDAETWPDGGGGVYCQDCWEATCDESWWAMLAAVARLQGESA